MWSSHRNQNWRSISLNLMPCPGSSSIKLRSHEDRATFCIDKQMATSLVIHEKTIAASPVKYCLTTTSQHGNIERFDLDLLENLSRTSALETCKKYRATFNRMSLKIETLQCPCAALLDFERHCWKRYDPTYIRNIALVCESGHVAFNPIVPSNERRSP